MSTLISLSRLEHRFDVLGKKNWEVLDKKSIRQLIAGWSQSKFRFYLCCVRTLNRKCLKHADNRLTYFLTVKAALLKQQTLFSTQFLTKQTLCGAPYFVIFTLFCFLEVVRLRALRQTGEWALPTFCRLNVNVKANNLRMHRGNDPVQVWLAWQTRFLGPTMVYPWLQEYSTELL